MLSYCVVIAQVVLGVPVALGGGESSIIAREVDTVVLNVVGPIRAGVFVPEAEDVAEFVGDSYVSSGFLYQRIRLESSGLTPDMNMFEGIRAESQLQAMAPILPVLVVADRSRGAVFVNLLD